MDISVVKNEFSAWCTFGDDVRVLIRHIPRHELREIYKQATTVEVIKGSKVEQFDPAKADLLLGRAAILNWNGFVDGEADFPCTKENIEFLMEKVNGFARFINEACIDIDFLVAQSREAERKN